MLLIIYIIGVACIFFSQANNLTGSLCLISLLWPLWIPMLIGIIILDLNK